MSPTEIIEWAAVVDLLQPGIYMIHCVASDKAYIGQQNQRGGFRARWAQHRYRFNKGTSGNAHMIASWKKYGADSFRFIALENCSPELLHEREAYYVQLLDPDACFNMAPIEKRLPPTDEYRQRQSARMKQHYADHPEKKRWTQDRSDAIRRFWNSPAGAARKAQLSAEKTGVSYGPLSDEHRAHLRSIHLGTKLSDATKAKIAAASKGHTLSAESREKVRQAKIGKPRPPHVIEAMREGQRRVRLQARG